MQDSLRFRRPRMKKSLGDEFIESSNWQMKRRWSQLSPLALAFVGGYIVVVYLICQRLDAALPTAIPVTAPLNRFSEGRARPWLDELTSFGPRPSGSPAAEVLAVNFILAQLEELRQTALVVGETLELSIQRPSGCFSLDFLSDFSLCYRNITNIAVRLKGSAVTHTSKSLLINCHFDSVPDSPGASDDAVSCAIATELIRNLINSNLSRIHDVIFLFNGGEENILQAAHGFITQHPWRRSIRAFINLEAAGSGGREMLFQSGPGHSWLLKHYLSEAVYPHATVMAQEIFQSGVIPSDTDYRIFRDYGAVPGLDIAYIKNGYVYHTEFDESHFIRAGSIQRAGENVLATVKSLANSPYLAEPNPFQDEPLVFFDVFGLFVVFYPLWLGVWLNYAFGGLLLLTVFRRDSLDVKENCPRVKDVLLASAVHLTVLAATGVVLLICAKLVWLLGICLCWYARPYLLIPLYVLPCVSFSIWLHGRAREWLVKSSPWLVEKAFRDSSIFLLLIVMEILTFCGFASSYLLLLYSVPPLLRGFILRLFAQFRISRNNLWSFMLSHLVSLLLPTMFASYGMLEVLHLFVPMMGRTGRGLNPELFIGALVYLGVISILLFFGSLIYLCPNSHALAKSMFLTAVLGYIIIFFTSLSQPYSYSVERPALRRLILQHSNRRIFNANNHQIFGDTGVLIVPMDYRGSLDLPDYTFLSASKPASECCSSNDSFCGFPFYLPVKQLFFENSRWMELATPLTFTHPVSVKLVSRTFLRNQVNITLSVSGSDHITLFVTANQNFNWRLAWWSLTDSVSLSPVTNFAFLGDGAAQGPWIFSLLLKRDESDIDENYNFSVTVAAAAHYLHGSDQNSDVLKNIRATVENRRSKTHLSYSWWRWANTIMGWSSDYESRQF